MRRSASTHTGMELLANSSENSRLFSDELPAVCSVLAENVAVQNRSAFTKVRCHSQLLRGR